MQGEKGADFPIKGARLPGEGAGLGIQFLRSRLHPNDELNRLDWLAPTRCCHCGFWKAARQQKAGSANSTARRIHKLLETVWRKFMLPNGVVQVVRLLITTENLNCERYWKLGSAQPAEALLRFFDTQCHLRKRFQIDNFPRHTCSCHWKTQVLNQYSIPRS